MEGMRNEKKTETACCAGFSVYAFSRADHGFSVVLDGKIVSYDAVRDLSETNAVAAENNSVDKLCGYHDDASVCKVALQFSVYRGI